MDAGGRRHGTPIKEVVFLERFENEGESNRIESSRTVRLLDERDCVDEDVQ